MLHLSPLTPRFQLHPLLPQTLRAYVDMLRMEDRLWGHPTYLKASRTAGCVPLAACG